MLTRDELILHQLHQVRRIAGVISRRCPVGLDVEDLVGAGHVGLLQAVDRFKPEKGVRFNTFVEHRIRGEMLDLIRSRCGRKGKQSRLAVPKDELFFARLRCPANTPEELSSARSTGARLEWAIGCLPRKQREIVRLMFFEDLMGPAIALRLGIHESRVSQLKKYALAHLRDLLATKP